MNLNLFQELNISFPNVVLLVIVGILFFYLFYALVFPERFV